MKAIIVTGDDFAALHFEDYFRGVAVSNIIEKVETEKKKDYYTEDGFFEITIVEAGEPSEKFISDIRSLVIDYDSSKQNNFWLENEKI